MRRTFSIAFLLFFTLVAAVAVLIWQSLQPMDHFEIAIAGALVEVLPSNTQLRINRNPDDHRRDEVVIDANELPARIQPYSRSGCVVEFWSGDEPDEEKLFSIAVDRELFDRFRVITLRLDQPTPELKPDPLFWASLRWSANITKRMRYVDLPSWDGKSLRPLQDLPNMVVTKQPADKPVLVEKTRLQRHDCDFDYFYGEFADGTAPSIEHNDKLHFSVTYDSGGLFKPIQTDFTLNYNAKRHHY